MIDKNRVPGKGGFLGMKILKAGLGIGKKGLSTLPWEMNLLLLKMWMATEGKI